MESFTNFILSKQSWTSDRDQQRRPGEDLNNVCSKVRSSNTQGLQTQDFQLVVIVVKGAMLSFWQLQQLLWRNILILFESHARTQHSDIPTEGYWQRANSRLYIFKYAL